MRLLFVLAVLAGGFGLPVPALADILKNPLPPPPNETFDLPPQASGQGITFLFSQPRDLCRDSIAVH